MPKDPLNITLQRQSEEPLYRQLIGQIRDQIKSGRPPIRDAPARQPQDGPPASASTESAMVKR